MATQLYPLKFTPRFKYRIWGGNKLKTILKKKYSENQIGESWEISDVEDDETLVKEGALKGKSLKDLMSRYGSDFLGKSVLRNFGQNFPLLIKYIDAAKPLSIQVHPNNQLAKERHNSFGKNEMWYIMEANPSAEILVGFSKALTKETYRTHIENNTIQNVLNTEKVKEGDTFHIPTGRVHAIGAGVLLAEIQQTSDITYRIYDYDRLDAKTGQQRELHTALSEDAIDFKTIKEYKTTYTLEKHKSNTLVHTPYFKTNIIVLDGTLDKEYSAKDSFVILMAVKGSFMLTHNTLNYSIKYGETILLPACVNQISIDGKGKLLEVSL